MKENLIKTIQKFLNTPFRYSELLKILDKQKDFLLTKIILEKTEDCEYNALWDMIMELEKIFLYANAPNLVIGAEISVLGIFDRNFKERKKNLTYKNKSSMEKKEQIHDILDKLNRGLLTEEKAVSVIFLLFNVKKSVCVCGCSERYEAPVNGYRCKECHKMYE